MYPDDGIFEKNHNSPTNKPGSQDAIASENVPVAC